MAKTTNATTSKAGRKRASRLSPQEREQQLLQLGVKAFAEKGIGNAKHADIAKAAGISVPTVFDYFPTKDALVNGILEEVAREFKAIYAAIDTDGDAREALLVSGRLLTLLVREKPEYARVWLMWGAIYSEDIRAGYQVLEKIFLRKATALLKNMFKQEKNEDMLEDRARLMVGAGTMLTKLALDEPSPERVERYVLHVADVLFSSRA
jgi:TetR/AcrR family hemagglutinin/protease transcriptional regulator